MMKKTILALLGFMLTLAVSAQTRVKDATTWTFASKQNGEVVADKTVEMNGLYLRGGAEKHVMTAKRSGCKMTLADGSQFAAKMAVYCAGNQFWKSIKPNSSVSQDNPKLDRTLAVETAVAGTLQIIAAPKGGLEGKERFAKLYFNGQEVYNRSFDDKGAFEVVYDAKEAGRFFFGANGGYYVYQVKFIPAK